MKVQCCHWFMWTYWTDPLLGFLPSLARRLLGERMSKPTGKFRACLFTWLVLSSEIMIVFTLLRKHNKKKNYQDSTDHQDIVLSAAS